MVSFSGRCLAHRAEIMQLHGAWAEALAEAERARERCERAMNAWTPARRCTSRPRCTASAATFAGGRGRLPRREPLRPGAAAGPRAAAARPGRRRGGGRRHPPGARRDAPSPRAGGAPPGAGRDRAGPGDVDEARAAATSSPRSPRATQPDARGDRRAGLGAVELAEGAPSAALLAAPARAADLAGARRAVRGRAHPGPRRPGLPRARRRGHRRAGAGGGPRRLRGARRGARPGADRARRAARRRTTSPRASSRCCGWSPPAGATARSPPSSS